LRERLLSRRTLPFVDRAAHAGVEERTLEEQVAGKLGSEADAAVELDGFFGDRTEYPSRVALEAA
jgi:hypothetical protein